MNEFHQPYQQQDVEQQHQQQQQQQELKHESQYHQSSSSSSYPSDAPNTILPVIYPNIKRPKTTATSTLTHSPNVTTVIGSSTIAKSTSSTLGLRPKRAISVGPHLKTVSYSFLPFEITLIYDFFFLNFYLSFS